MDSQKGRSASTDRRFRSRDGSSQCYHYKGYGHLANMCPSEGFYKVGPNGMPVRATGL